MDSPVQELKLNIDSIPESIKDWLSSDTVFNISEEIIKRFGLVKSQKNAISFATTGVILRKIEPKKFISTLIEEFLIQERNAIEIASVVKNRILEPVKPGLVAWLGINLNDLTALPQSSQITARTMSIEGNISKAVHVAAPAPVQKTPAQILQEEQQLRARTMQVEGGITDPQKLAQKQAAEKAHAVAAAAQAEQLHARTMEFQGSFAPVSRTPKTEVKKMVDIKKPEQKAAAGPNAQITKIEGSLTPLNQVSSTPDTGKPAVAAPTVKKPEQRADELQTTAPIGLSEVIPQAPTSQPASPSQGGSSVSQWSVGQQEVPQNIASSAASWPTEPEVIRAPVTPPVVAKPISQPPASLISEVDKSKLTPPVALPTNPLPSATANPIPHEMVKYQDEHPARQGS